MTGEPALFGPEAAAPLPGAAPAGEVSGLTATVVTDMLRRFYLPPSREHGGIFASEITSPCGKRRADAMWMPTTHAEKYALHGHEIKVSRSDLLAELAEPAKADPWLQYCTYWWLVVSRPDMVAGLDVPAAWGIMAPPSGRRTRTMTIIRPAPRLTPVHTAPALGRIAKWYLNDSATRISELERQLAEEQKRTARLLNRLDNPLAPASPDAQLVARVLAKLRARVQEVDAWWAGVDEDAVVEALLHWKLVADAARLVHRRTSLAAQHVQQVLADVTDPLRAAEKALARVREHTLADSDPSLELALASVKSTFPGAAVADDGTHA